MKKLIIIPAYNESECIEATVRDIMENASDFDYVIINTLLSQRKSVQLADFVDNMEGPFKPKIIAFALIIPISGKTGRKLSRKQLIKPINIDTIQ